MEWVRLLPGFAGSLCGYLRCVRQRGKRLQWGDSTGGMLEVDPVLVGLITVILLFILFVYLMIRRTVTAFTDGMREGSKRD